MPDEGVRLVIEGSPSTAKLAPLLAIPPTVTTMFPDVAPLGTLATIKVFPQSEIAVAAVPLKLTVLAPCVEPKFDPEIVTGAPTAAVPGETLVIVGTGTTEKFAPLLAFPLTVTTTFPLVAPIGTVATIEVALQLPIVVAGVPLNVTVLVPCVDPKVAPVIVTLVPTGPEVGDTLLMFGVTVKFMPLLSTPLA